MSGGAAADYVRALIAKGVTDLQVVHHITTGSTNDDARALASGGELAEHTAAIVIAEQQTKGRGRGGNAWFSPHGSIFMTLTIPDIGAAMLGVLPLGVGASVVASLRSHGAPASVKWPNDILLNGLKVCGILCESSLLGALARVFIGIGINVNDVAPDASAAMRATALDVQGVEVDRPALVADVAARVLGLARSGATNAAIVESWKAVSVPWWGEKVSFIDGDLERNVTLLDVNPEGQLVVRDEAGVIRSYVSGEIRQLRILPS